MKSSTIYKYIVELLYLLFMANDTLCGNFTDWRKDACGTHGVCTCYTEKLVKVVYCRDRNLTALPFGIMIDAGKIVLGDNKINDLKPDSFVRQRFLQYLDISFNRLRDLPTNLLSTTTSLVKLDISHNKISRLDKDFFSALLNLKILVLSGNNLRTIAENLFSNLLNLEKLHMEYNDLNMASLKFIEKSTNLEILHLSGNKVKTMTRENFQSIHNLVVLCVSDNDMLIESTGWMSSLPGLQMLCLSSNTILEVPPDSFSKFSKMQVLRIANSTLKDIPDQLLFSMGLLKELDLSDNFLLEIRSRHFATLQELKDLTLSNNKIQRIEEESFKNLTNVRAIDLRKNQLKTLPEGLFTHSNHLVTLNLEENELVAFPTTLFGQSSELQWLYMSGNQIEEFAEGTFSNLTRLEYLILSNNKIEYLPAMIFAPLRKLTVLQLNDNNLKELSNNLFLKLDNLFILLLTANRIRKVPKHLFISQRKSKKIDLSLNVITEIPENMLPAVNYLENIDLSHNNLKMLPHNFLDSARKIGTLYLSHNSIENITKENFGSLEEAENLYLSQNQLLHLPQDLFSEVQISNTLDLSNNRLRKLSFGLFDSNNKTHGLQTLLLQRNFLTHLPANIFKGLKNLKSLCLFHNNIQHLAGSVFAHIGVEKIYLFRNNLSVFADTPFDNKHIQEIHLYGNNITHLSGTALAGLDRTTKVFIDCEQMEGVLRTNLYITCVTPQYVPKLQVNRNLMSSFRHEGFHCNVEIGVCGCSPCPRGTYGDGLQLCLPCPPGGFYQDDIGTVQLVKSEVCKRCRNGTFVKKGGAISIADCMVCPDGTKKDIHAGYRACFCVDNYARIDRFGPCFVCQEEGVTCLDDYKSITSGFYWNWDFQNANLSRYRLFVNNLKIENETFDTNTAYNGQIPRAYRCPRRESCTSTPGDIEATCTEGYRGWLCNKCEANFYSVMNYCLPCPDPIALIIEILLVTAFCIAVYIVILRHHKRKKGKTQSSKSVVNIVISRAKIALGFYQVVGEIFSSLPDVNWAGALRYVRELILFIELNIFRIFIRPQCLHKKFFMNPKLEFTIAMIFICAVLILSMLLYQVMRIRYILRARGTVGAYTINDYTKPLKTKLITCVIILLFVTYPPICTIIFQLYPQACETFCFDVTNRECVTVLRSDYDLNCKDLRMYNAYAYVATVGYVLTFPFALFLWLRVIFRSRVSTGLHTSSSALNEENLRKMQNLTDETFAHENKNPMWVDFLCENYKPQYWYWEIVELARKVTQTFIITLLGWEDKLTVLVTIGISVLFLTLHARCMPMKSSFEQYLQMFSLTAIFANILVAAMGAPDEFEGALTYALVVLNIVVITIIAGEIVVGLSIRLRHLRMHEAISRCCV